MNAHKLAKLTVALSLSALIVGSCGLWRKETKITMNELPEPVRIAVQKITAGSTVTEIEKIESGGKVTYEVEYLKDGKNHETYFAPDGTIVKGAQ